MGFLFNDFEMDLPIYSVLLWNNINDNKTGYSIQNTEITAGLYEYPDVLPEQLSRGLLPKRTVEEFQIQLKERAKPIKKGIYRMSHTELDETKKQVGLLLKMGLIRPSKSL